MSDAKNNLNESGTSKCNEDDKGEESLLGDAINDKGKRELLEIGSTTCPIGHSLFVENRKKPKIGSFTRSSLFDKLDQFLPQLSKSNERVTAEIQANPEVAKDKYDIESAENAERVIEMNVSLLPLEKKEDEERIDNLENMLASSAADTNPQVDPEKLILPSEKDKISLKKKEEGEKKSVIVEMN